jgi:D-inositol-3-phosphate glycosyltransferase
MIKRIAMLSVHTCPLAALGGKETGGMNVYVRDLSRELGRRGIHVDAFTRSQNPAIPKVSHALGLNGRMIHLPAGPEVPYDKNLVFDHLPEFLEGVKGFAQEEGITYDLIHSHYWLSGWVARELKRDWQIPIIQMFHTLGRMKNTVAQSEEEMEVARRIEVETEIMAFADRIVAATTMEKSQMIQLYGADPAKIAIIPCGVDLSLFRPIPVDEARQRLDICERKHMVLFVGRIERLKGIDTLLEAMAIVVRNLPNWQEELCVCIVGGDASEDSAVLDKEMERLQDLRAKLGIADLVTFLGAQAQETLPDHYSAADVVVMPSHYESFGMVALEAMACGTPVIASQVGGLSFTVQDGVTGFLVPGQDPPALAEKITLLLKDHALRNKLGAQGIEWAQQHGWARIADQVVSLYSDLVHEKAHEYPFAGKKPCPRSWPSTKLSLGLHRLPCCPDVGGG